MDERIRASDADRDRVTTRLQEHFAAGRLTRDELDERITAVLHAKTSASCAHRWPICRSQCPRRAPR